MKSYNNMGEFAEYGIPLANIEATFANYNAIADKQEKDPDNGPYDAYGGGKSWDVWGKKFYHNLPMKTDDAFHVAIVTPVIHYCMGGLEINPDAGFCAKMALSLGVFTEVVKLQVECT